MILKSNIDPGSGECNAEADCLSRNPVLEGEEGKEGIEPIKTVNTLTLEEIKIGQEGVRKKDKDELKHGIIVRKRKKKERIVLNESTMNQQQVK